MICFQRMGIFSLAFSFDFPRNNEIITELQRIDELIREIEESQKNFSLNDDNITEFRRIRELRRDLLREIEDDRRNSPLWRRCQSLASAARSIPDRNEQEAILDDAFKTALDLDSPNRIVSVSAWPLEVLAETKNYDRFDRELDRLLRLIDTEPHPIRRCDAVFQLLRLGRQAHQRSIIKITNALIAHCSAGHGWKRDRNLRDAAMILKHVGLQEYASRCIKIIEKPRVRRQAQRMLNEYRHAP
ncbi:MAG: hypothetical protein GX594_07570 [Pirellulaceae bacterium]|nr:hypothetical protein [Pirellulaceae bacterium]